MILEDIAALDRDIGRAMAGTISFSDLFGIWIANRQETERREYARYISERVHDVLLAWTR